MAATASAVPEGVCAAAVTPFQRRVYDCLVRVPPGRVVTYGALARAIGCRAPQAVGQALKKNPFAPTVPCHRVVATAGRPGGFYGEISGATLERKFALLKAEGVRFGADGRLEDAESVLLADVPPA